MRKKLDVYLTGIGTKKCFTVLIGGCPEKLF
jgi:hypothetical protein